jgi:hypothetical protein
MLDKHHLHIDQNDQIVNWLTKSLKSAYRGTIKIDFEDQRAVQIDINKNKIIVDLLEAKFFRAPEDETGLFDKLKTAKEFAEKLTANGLTITFHRRGKEAITIGKDARPTLSKVVTRSDDIQINSIRESGNLKHDLEGD